MQDSPTRPNPPTRSTSLFFPNAAGTSLLSPPIDRSRQSRSKCDNRPKGRERNILVHGSSRGRRPFVANTYCLSTPAGVVHEAAPMAHSHARVYTHIVFSNGPPSEGIVRRRVSSAADRTWRPVGRTLSVGISEEPRRGSFASSLPSPRVGCANPWAFRTTPAAVGRQTCKISKRIALRSRRRVPSENNIEVSKLCYG